MLGMEPEHCTCWTNTKPVYYTLTWLRQKPTHQSSLLGKERGKQEEGGREEKMGGREAAAQMPKVEELLRKGERAAHIMASGLEDVAAKKSKRIH